MKTTVKNIVIRAVKTFAQTLVGYIGAAQFFDQVNWVAGLSMAGLAAVASVLTNIGSLEDPVAPAQPTVTGKVYR